MEKRFRGNEYRTTVVCVDSYEDGILVGRFYNPYNENGQSFKSLTKFLINMEDMLDAMKHPQTFSARRSFADSPLSGVAAMPEDKEQVGKLGTFLVRVLFRRDADWQGTVTWLEGSRDEGFRSVLELIFLMDGALNSMM